MFYKEIEFLAHEDYYSICDTFPTPIKLNIPEWYKKLKHSMEDMTVKGCMPFLDTLTTGYLLKIPQDIKIIHNVINDKGEKDSFIKYSLTEEANFLDAKKINLNYKVDVHVLKQVEGSPFVEKNKNMPIYKIANPWRIKTPKGYSCLFLPPLNNSDDRFSILSGIVDTDCFPIEINFPIIINGDKYSILDTVIKKGTPYVQVIPFKREEWKMKCSKLSQSSIVSSIIGYKDTLFQMYKNKFWKKKLWN